MTVRPLAMLGTADVRSAAEARSLVAPLVRLFVTGLSRPPTADELASWVPRLRAGEGLGAAAREVVADPGFIRRHGPGGPANALTVRSLFWAIDGRDPPGGEIARLLAQPGLTRASLLTQVSQSARAHAAITLERDAYRGRLEPGDDVAYQLWLEHGGERPDMPGGPIPSLLVSLVLLADRSRPDRLQHSLASLAAQSSPHWEAVVVAVGSAPPDLGPAAADSRVRALPDAGASWAEANSNGAAHAAGALVGFMAAGDTLALSAVEATARLAAGHPELRLIYTDEDRRSDDGFRSEVVLKGGWSPDLLLSGDALGQLALFDRQRVLAAGGLAEDAGAFALLDLALRLTHDASPGMAAHLPGVLFHRGSPDGMADRFPHCRTGNGVPQLDGVIDRFLAAHRPGITRTSRREGSRLWPAFTAALPSPAPAVSVIVPTKDRAGLLRECLEGLLGTTSYPALEVLIVDNGSTEPDALAVMAQAAADCRVRVLRIAGPFNWSALNNAAAAEAVGEVLVLLNNDVSGMEPDWLAKLAGQAMRADVGVAGARLLFPDGTLQHGGILLGPGGEAAHAMTGAPRDEPGYLAQAALLRDLSAVTGACLAIRKAVFQQVGGLEQDHLRIAWSDIDLCLRVREAGYRVLWCPDVTLVHREVATRGQDVTLDQQVRHQMERAYTRRRWPGVTDSDPFLNPALSAAPRAMLLRARQGTPPAGPDEPDDRIEHELHLRGIALEKALAESEAEVSNLRSGWPWAELQRLHTALEDANTRLHTLSARAALHPWLVDRALALQHRGFQLRSVWRLARRVAGLAWQSPRRLALLRQRRADYAVIAASPVFDRAWYRAHVMGGDGAGDPVSHYLWRGAPAGHNPHALFDGAWYAGRVPDLGIETPFAHYLRRGMAADEDPHPLFDTRFYLTQAPEAAGQALHHYWASAATTTRSPAPLFDPFDNAGGLARWAHAGAAKDADPHALFSTAWYRQAQLGGDRTANPLAHWMRTGAAGGIPPNPYGLAPAWTPLVSKPAPAPYATVIVQQGCRAVDTRRTLISLIRTRTELPFELLLAGAGPAQNRLAVVRTVADRAEAIATSQGRYLAFLAPGAVAHEGWLEALAATADADPGIGIAAPVTLDANAMLRSVGATLYDSGLIQHEGAGTAPGLPQHRFARTADAVDGTAMLVRREAWNAANPFDIDYDNGALNAAALSLALREAGWRVVVQPASVVTLPVQAGAPSAAEAARFTHRWATLLSRQPPPGTGHAAWRGAGLRTLVLAEALPSLAGTSPATLAVHALLVPGTRVALHATEAQADLATIAGWERLGVELLRPPADLGAWLKEFGPFLDEIVSFRALESPLPDDLLRWTAAPIRTLPFQP